MTRALLAAAFSLSLAACFDSGDKGDDTGDAGSGSGEYAVGFNEGIPCGQILDCFTLCDGDEACNQACYDDANTDSQAIFDALDACFVENGCSDWSCMEASCPQELETCEYDVPEGGQICFAEGAYNACDSYGACSTQSAYGGAWGASTEAAGFWAVFDCTEFMTSMIIINSINGTASSAVSCQVTECSANE